MSRETTNNSAGIWSKTPCEVLFLDRLLRITYEWTDEYDIIIMR